MTNITLPWIDGQFPYAGSLFRCFPGVWSETPLVIAYQWVRDSLNIPGATSDTYIATSDDVGKTLSCTVTATLSGGGEATDTENSVAISGTHLDTGLPLDANGYHDVDAIINRPGKYTDSRIIYLDPTNGDDSTAVNYVKSDAELNGTPSTPGAVNAYKTQNAAFGNIRSGFADVVLVKRGETIGEIWFQSKRGKSADERLIISCYGESGSLPTVKNGMIMRFQGASDTRDIIIANMQCYYSVSDPDSPEFTDAGGSHKTLKAIGEIPSSGVLLEGILSRFAQMDFQMEATDYIVRRCVIVDSYGRESHAQGIYNDGTELTIEECVVDHCGWNDTVNGGGKTIFNHNMYFQNGQYATRVVGSISSRASSHGCQLRQGGHLVNNLFLNNPLNMLLGGGTTPSASGVSVVATRNSIIGSSDISGSDRGFSIDVTNVRTGDISKNIVAHKLVGGANDAAFFLNSWSGSGGPDMVGVNNVSFRDNLFWDWKGGMSLLHAGSLSEFTAPGFWNLKFHNNHVYEVNNGYIKTSVSSAYSQIDFSGNKFHRDTGTAVANVDSSDKTLAEFNSLLGYTGIEEWSDYADYAVPTIDDYMTYIGQPGDGLDEFLVGCRSQSIDSWDARFTASSVNSFLRAATRISPLGTTSPEIATVTVAENGTTVTITTTEPVTVGTDGWVGITVGGVPLTYVSGDGTSSVTFAAGTAIGSGRVKAAYDQPGRGVQNPAGDLIESFFGLVATNNVPAPAIVTPTVTTGAVTDLITTSATVAGEVTDDGGATVSVRGICYSTSPAPTTADTVVTAGSGVGAFTAELSGLTADTAYHVRAYATNSAGIGYGNNVLMRTLSSKSWQLMDGETASTLSIPDVQAGDYGRQFRCVATNAAGSATSNTVEILAP